MKKRQSWTLRISIYLFMAALSIIMLSGSSCGGGGGGSDTPLPPINQNPLHTNYSIDPAYVSSLGQAYVAKSTVYETRGDEIEINRIKTWRTFSDNSGHSGFYYDGGAAMISGWMLFPSNAAAEIRNAVIEDTSNAPNRSFYKLQGYEQRTLRTQVMIGNEYQSKPAWFNGIFINYADYANWIMSGKTGVKYWIRFEGYDHKLKDYYNVNLSIDVFFSNSGYNSSNPYPVNPPNPGDTNPYDPFSPSKKGD